MTDESTGEWIGCFVDSDYEIWNKYPYSIRRKGTDRITNEWIDKGGYVKCSMNRKAYLKHRIIAQQFIPNPNNLPQIDHIDNDKTNNSITNLRWCSASMNLKNRSGHKGYQYVFIDELPETAEPLERYNKHEFNELWIDYETQKLYVFNGSKYRELLELHNQYSTYYQAYDRNDGKKVRLYHNILFD